MKGTCCAKQNVKNGPMLWTCRIRKVKHTPPGPQDDTVQWFFLQKSSWWTAIFSLYMNGVIFILIGKLRHKPTSPVMSYKSYGF